MLMERLEKAEIRNLGDLQALTYLLAKPFVIYCKWFIKLQISDHICYIHMKCMCFYLEIIYYASKIAIPLN